MRRPRYKGKYPKKPQDKYKELNPDDYQEDIAHIESKGRTPLGTHKPIMVEEILEVLKPKPGERAMDLTLGYGGHATAILEKLGPHGHLLGVDQDSVELPKTAQRLISLGFDETVFTPVHSNFRHLRKIIHDRTEPKVDLILADLGLSSMQIDRPERGFSSKHDTTLDFRMDSGKGKTALEVLKELDQQSFEKILIEFGDEPFPHRIGKEILQAVKNEKIKTTADLKKTIVEVVAKIKKYPGNPDKAVSRIFQALRIHINEELDALDELLMDLPEFLNSGARIAFLTFHSGEDRRVKKFLKQGLADGLFLEISGPIKASDQEVFANRRARSAKLRWATKS